MTPTDLLPFAVTLASLTAWLVLACRPFVVLSEQDDLVGPVAWLTATVLGLALGSALAFRTGLIW